MKLQELVNKLSNILASGAGEADVKVDDKHVESVIFVETDGAKTVVITGPKLAPLETSPLTR